MIAWLPSSRNSPVVDLRAYLTSFFRFDPEQMLTADEDFSIVGIDTIPDEEMPPTQKEMARSLIPPLRTAELKAMSAIVHAAMPLEATWGATGGVVAGAKPLSVFGRWARGCRGDGAQQRREDSGGACTSDTSPGIGASRDVTIAASSAQAPALVRPTTHAPAGGPPRSAADITTNTDGFAKCTGTAQRSQLSRVALVADKGLAIRVARDARRPTLVRNRFGESVDRRHVRDVLADRRLVGLLTLEPRKRPGCRRLTERSSEVDPRC